MSRRSMWAQVVVAYALLEVAFWSTGRTQAVVSWLVAAWIVLCVARSGRSAAELGLASSGFARAAMAIPIAALSSAAMALIAWATGSLRVLHGDDPAWAHVLAYSGWALFQQFMLQSFFYLNFEHLLRSGRKAMWVTASLFAIAHIPNPVLVPASFMGSLFFIAVFRHSHNIYPLGAAHALLGLAIAVSVPDPVLRHMRVGIGYFRYQAVSQEASRQPPSASISRAGD